MPWTKSAGIAILRTPFLSVRASKCRSIDLFASIEASAPRWSIGFGVTLLLSKKYAGQRIRSFWSSSCSVTVPSVSCSSISS